MVPVTWSETAAGEHQAARIGVEAGVAAATGAGRRNGAVVVDQAGARRRAGDGQAARRGDIDTAASGVRRGQGKRLVARDGRIVEREASVDEDAAAVGLGGSAILGR